MQRIKERAGKAARPVRLRNGERSGTLHPSAGSGNIIQPLPGREQLAATTAESAHPVPTTRVINGSPPATVRVRWPSVT